MKFARLRHIALLFTVILFAGVSADGQNIARYRTMLSHPDASTRASVSVTEYGNAESAVKQYDHLPHPDKIPGYRIRIFFDNSQNARAQAIETQNRFKNEFPGIPTFLGYENPSYIVTVGNCASIDEALMLWNKVKKSFNTAFLWRGELPIEDLAANRYQSDDLTADSNQTQN